MAVIQDALEQELCFWTWHKAVGEVAKRSR